MRKEARNRIEHRLKALFEPKPLPVMELSAIWMKSPLYTGQGRVIRLAPGATVRIEADELRHVTEASPATHVVVKCMGRVASDFSLLLRPINGGEVITIEI